MMLTRLHGHGEVGVVLVGAHPRSVQPDLRRHAAFEAARFADVLDEVNHRLAGFGLRERVLGFVELHVETRTLRTAGWGQSTRLLLGKCGDCQEHYDKSGSHDSSNCMIRFLQLTIALFEVPQLPLAIGSERYPAPGESMMPLSASP